MTGTLINTVAILAGGTLGLLFGARLPERIRATVIAGIGLFTLATGIQLFLETENSIIVLASLVLGGLLGELLGIEAGLSRLGAFLEGRFNNPGRGNQPAVAGQAQDGRKQLFIRGFLTASLVYCIGPMAILGAIQDGLVGDIDLLLIKSTLDGVASIAFASSLGAGVLFAALPVLVYQGAISLLALQAQAAFTQPMMSEMTAAGGVLLVGIAISGLLEIKSIRVGNFLPALAIAPLIVALLALFG
jgi:uncharacterized membrane protein YqgA involved in biofilm formation